MPEARLGHDAIWHQGKIYVVGGEGKGDASRVLIFDPATNSWSKGASMPTPRHHVSAFVHKDKIYVAGGQAHGNVVRTVEVYDPRTNAWSRAPDLPAYMSGANTVSVGGRIYGFGGEGPRWPAIPWLSWKVNPDIYTLDPATDTWRTVGTMRLPRHGMGAVPIGDRAYLGFGATAARGFPFTETAAIEWFNPGPN